MNTDQKEIFFSVVVPNYNGEHIIARCLSSIIISARQTQIPFEIIIVDDGSTDKSREIIREKFPNVRLLENQYNSGFPASINRGVRAADGKIAVLLNSDMVVQPEFFSLILQHFIEDDEEHIFGVSGKTLRWDTGEPDHLCMTSSFKKGFFHLEYSDHKESVPALFLIGGACAIRRRIFMMLGGFSLIFSPGYWEDYDLAYMAVKGGFRNVYEPHALAYHFGQATTGEIFSQDMINTLKLRNELLFTWINLSDWKLWFQHLFFLPIRMATECLKGEGCAFNKAVVKAIRRLPEVMYYRRRRRALFQISDRKVIESFVSPDRKPSKSP